MAPLGCGMMIMDWSSSLRDQSPHGSMRRARLRMSFAGRRLHMCARTTVNGKKFDASPSYLST